MHVAQVRGTHQRSSSGIANLQDRSHIHLVVAFTGGFLNCPIASLAANGRDILHHITARDMFMNDGAGYRSISALLFFLCFELPVDLHDTVRIDAIKGSISSPSPLQGTHDDASVGNLIFL